MDLTSPPQAAPIRGAVFDKDGTLFDFRASWGAWTRRVLDELTRSPEQAGQIARKLGFDPATGDFAPGSIVIAHTTFEIADALAGELTHLPEQDLRRQLERLAQTAPMVPAVDLPAVFGDLRDAGLRIGLATNDTEAPARHHLDRAGVLPLFDFVAGCDSGWGGKPAPGQLLAFARACGLAPGQIVMVGDSVHDMQAGRAAGMACVAVLTGIALEPELQPHADAVLPDISALLGWIQGQNALCR